MELDMTLAHGSQPAPATSPNTDPGSPSSSPKAQAIRDACRDGNLLSLVALAASQGGLLTDELRTLACKRSNIQSYDFPGLGIGHEENILQHLTAFANHRAAYTGVCFDGGALQRQRGLEATLTPSRRRASQIGC
jgi:hypothetical protein